MQFADAPERHTGIGLLIIMGLVVLSEAIWIIYGRKHHYDWKASLASFGVAIIKRGTDALSAGISGYCLFLAYEYRIFSVSLDSAWKIGGFFLLFEFFYYWQHRMAHEVRWMWATHSVHHSPEEMNLSVAVRLGWTGLISGNFLFYLPLALLGFHPVAIVVALTASLFYQIWIHTELIDRLPAPFEWLLNTPSHHRVHHASNAQYLDRNYGGTLILWDRIFGTFSEEKAPPVYGLTAPLRSYNPFRLALHEWSMMARDLFHSRQITHIFSLLFGPPGWTPDNKRQREKIQITNPFQKQDRNIS